MGPKYSRPGQPRNPAVLSPMIPEPEPDGLPLGAKSTDAELQHSWEPVTLSPNPPRPPDFRPYIPDTAAELANRVRFASRMELIRHCFLIEHRVLDTVKTSNPSLHNWHLRAESEPYDELPDVRLEVSRLREESEEIEYRIIRRLEYVVE